MLYRITTYRLQRLVPDPECQTLERCYDGAGSDLLRVEAPGFWIQPVKCVRHKNFNVEPRDVR